MNKIHTLEPGNEEITAKKIITVSDARLNFFQVFHSQLQWLSCVLYSMTFFGFISSFRNQYNHRCFKEQIPTFLLCIYYSPTSLSQPLVNVGAGQPRETTSSPGLFFPGDEVARETHFV